MESADQIIGRKLENEPFVLLDGALATELEAHGVGISDRLWSAGALMRAPDAIRAVHLSYFRAGAEIATSASYQASVRGFSDAGLSEKESLALIEKSVKLAAEAREIYLSETGDSGKALLVAGSAGPYGACLADGSEYRGDYRLSEKEFMDFHRPRLEALLRAGADLIAFETQPSFEETLAAVSLLGEYPEARAWITFTLRDPLHISDGTPVREAVRAAASSSQVVFSGVNCVKPEDAAGALRAMREVSDIPLAVYPNSGESYDPGKKCWSGCACGEGGDDSGTLVRRVPEWIAAGARLIGGCCRTTPEDIAALGRFRARV